MDSQPDLTTAAHRLGEVVAGVRDDQLGLATPCKGRTVSQLLAHIHGLTAAFRASADKEFGPLTDTNPDAAGWPEAPPGWREEIPERALALGQAWSRQEAWTGMTRAGGAELPAEVMGHVALGEVTLHAWDLAVATGQELTVDDQTVSVLADYVEGFDPSGTPGMFAAAVRGDHWGNELDRALARTGRDPNWEPPRAPA